MIDEGGPLSYTWDFGDGTNSSDANPTAKTYAANGSYTVTLTVSDGEKSSQAEKKIVAGSTPPVITSITPDNDSPYSAGDTISFTTTATDGEDATLPDSAYRWTVEFHHADHIHPFADNIVGPSGSVTIPRDESNLANTWYRITLTVTDSSGLSTSELGRHQTSPGQPHGVLQRSRMRCTQSTVFRSRATIRSWQSSASITQSALHRRSTSAADRWCSPGGPTEGSRPIPSPRPRRIPPTRSSSPITFRTNAWRPSGCSCSVRTQPDRQHLAVGRWIRQLSQHHCWCADLPAQAGHGGAGGHPVAGPNPNHPQESGQLFLSGRTVHVVAPLWACCKG